jgi:hypothetical protein
VSGDPRAEHDERAFIRPGVGQAIRVEGPVPLILDGPLPAGHPLSDTPIEARAKRRAQAQQFPRSRSGWRRVL